MKNIFLLWVGIFFITTTANADEWTRGEWHVKGTKGIILDSDSTLLSLVGVVGGEDYNFTIQEISLSLIPSQLFLNTGDKISLKLSTSYKFALSGFVFYNIKPSDDGDSWKAGYYNPGSYSVLITIPSGGRGLWFNFLTVEVPQHFGQPFSLTITEVSIFHLGNWERIDGFIRPIVDPGIPVAVDNSSLQTPTAFALHQNFPNPFNASTTIRFDLSQPGEATLAVYSVNGQLVCTLAFGTYPAGTHQVVWNGRVNSGQPVPTGIYLCRLITANRVAVKKINLLK